MPEAGALIIKVGTLDDPSVYGGPQMVRTRSRIGPRPRRRAADEAVRPAVTPHIVFLLSPAHLGGERARLVFHPDARFELAERLRSPAGAPLAAVFAFLSGLYFRGKITYAEAFGRPPPGLSGGLVISPGAGLRFPHEPVTLERLAEWSKVPIDASNPRFTRPLVEHAAALDEAHGATTRFVLLGSVATDKYVEPLTKVFGDRLLFPPDFIGRGDMSRGALLLRAARARCELAYVPVVGARRHGPRAPGVAETRRVRSRPAEPQRDPTERADQRDARPEVVILVGLPGAGKTTFFEQRLAATHVHVSKDRFPNNRRPAHRQAELIEEALAAHRSVVVDNTNVTVAERAPILSQARAHGARVVGFVFDCTTRECVARNAARAGPARIPNVGIFAAAKRFSRPVEEEGFDELYVVRPLPGPAFEVRRA